MSLFSKAKEPKKLVMLEGLKHHHVYKDPRGFEAVMTPTLAWLSQWVPDAHFTVAHGSSFTHAAIGGHGALMHWTCWASQCVPDAHFTVAHGFFFFSSSPSDAD